MNYSNRNIIKEFLKIKERLAVLEEKVLELEKPKKAPAKKGGK